MYNLQLAFWLAKPNNSGILIDKRHNDASLFPDSEGATTRLWHSPCVQAVSVMMTLATVMVNVITGLLLLTS